MANSKKKNIKKVEYNNDTEISKLIKLVVIVTLIAFAFYGITILINKRTEEETPEEVYERGYVEGFNREYDEKKNYDASSSYIVNKEEYEEGYEAGYKWGKDKMKNKY